jgi:hypothetical protein
LQNNQRSRPRKIEELDTKVLENALRVEKIAKIQWIGTVAGGPILSAAFIIMFYFIPHFLPITLLVIFVTLIVVSSVAAGLIIRKSMMKRFARIRAELTKRKMENP